MIPFYVIDLDRTLVNTEKLYEVLELVLERDTDVGTQRLNEERAAIEANGESFVMVNSLRRILEAANSTVSWQELQRAFILEAQHTGGVLEPYAAELLQILNDRQLPYGIITYGSEAWQLAKIEAAGLMDVPHLVTRIKEKGRLLTGWKHAGDTFIIPPAMTHDFTPLEVDSIVFLDDKAVSFNDMPTGVRGVFVKSPTRELLESQRGALPSSVATVVGLNGAIELLFK
ncbi:MAG: hypothetical protein JWP06_129 [Candidatus Saccharibacteria bacterium]|nr:hypothetical protein [Candidatus Saccharibacteria bacterium]